MCIIWALIHTGEARLRYIEDAEGMVIKPHYTWDIAKLTSAKIWTANTVIERNSAFLAGEKKCFIDHSSCISPVAIGALLNYLNAAGMFRWLTCTTPFDLPAETLIAYKEKVHVARLIESTCRVRTYLMAYGFIFEDYAKYDNLVSELEAEFHRKGPDAHA